MGEEELANHVKPASTYGLYDVIFICDTISSSYETHGRFFGVSAIILSIWDMVTGKRRRGGCDGFRVISDHSLSNNKDFVHTAGLDAQFQFFAEFFCVAVKCGRHQTPVRSCRVLPSLTQNCDVCRSSMTKVE